MIALANRMKSSTKTAMRRAYRGLCDKSHGFGMTEVGLRCGVDLVDLDEFTRAVELGRERFLNRIYTCAEQEFCRGRISRLASRFAAKEATAKLLGTGIRSVGWRDIEVVSLAHGEPTLLLHGRAASRANTLGLHAVSLSLCHTRTTAVAIAIGICHTQRRHGARSPDEALNGRKKAKE